MGRFEIAGETLRPGRIARFWLPLEATWLMMAAEGPFLAALIARLPVATENLAAFGVASALAWIVESPVIMMLSAANALVRDAVAFRKLRRFSFTMNAGVTAVMAILVSPPVFGFVARRVIGLEAEVAAMAGRAMVFLVVWPGAIGFRRFYQGLMIRDGRPQAVTWGTVVRLTTMAATGIVLAVALRLPGASAGTGALGMGVLAEAAASWVMARPTVRGLRIRPGQDCRFGRCLTAGGIVRFYAPLALTSVLSFVINPLTTFFLARGARPLESLAVLPVLIGLAFMFRTAGIALQEVVIALVGDSGENRRTLARFSVGLGAASSFTLAAVVFTPLARVWYQTVSGLPGELVAFSVLPGGLLVFLPFLESVLSWQRGVLVKAHRTAPISTAVAAQLGLTALTFAAIIFSTGAAGIMAVGPALTAGYVAGTAVLAKQTRTAPDEETLTPVEAEPGP